MFDLGSNTIQYLTPPAWWRPFSEFERKDFYFWHSFKFLHRLTPRPHVSVFVWKRRFFLLMGHTFSVETVPENASFQKRSPEWRFLKTLATRSRVNGRKRSFSNTMMYWIHHLLLAFRMLCSAFSYGRTKTIRIRYVWTCIFLQNGGKNLGFESIRMRVATP